MRLQEAVLARQLGISRGPLREAIRRLEGRNLVIRVPHVGVRIADPSREEILDMFLLREALEGIACRLAAERMTELEIEALANVLLGHAEQPDVATGGGYYQLPGDQDFHYQIIRGSRSARLEDMLLGDLYHFLRVFRYRSSIEDGGARTAHSEHMKIMEALRRRDAVAAEDAMRQHVGNARASLAEAMAQHAGQNGRGT
jgi:DNA-binding GntR family transcriptional regulator